MENSTQFLAPGRFQRLVTRGTLKFVRRQNSSILSFLAVFMGNSTQFLAPRTISTARDPPVHENWDIIKLIDLVISGCFRGL